MGGGLGGQRFHTNEDLQDNDARLTSLAVTVLEEGMEHFSIGMIKVSIFLVIMPKSNHN